MNTCRQVSKLNVLNALFLIAIPKLDASSSYGIHRFTSQTEDSVPFLT